MAIVTACSPNARARSVLLAEVGRNGTPALQIMFEIESGEYKGESIRWDGWLTTEKAMLRTFDSMQSCGWQGSPSEINSFRNPDAPLNGIGDLAVQLVIEMELYNGDDEKHAGKSFPKVAWVNRVGGGRVIDTTKATSEGNALRFADKLNALVERERQKNPNYGKPLSVEDNASFPHGAAAPGPALNGTTIIAGVPAKRMF